MVGQRPKWLKEHIEFTPRLDTSFGDDSVYNSIISPLPVHVAPKKNFSMFNDFDNSSLYVDAKKP